jgi:acetyl esterase
VVAIDVRLAGEVPFPGSVADVNYGIRWLKSKALEWNGDPDTLDALGSSNGGHVIELIAMRPHDLRYTMYVLSESPGLGATLTNVISRSPSATR